MNHFGSLPSASRRTRHFRHAVTISLFVALTQYVGYLPVFRDRLQAYLGIGADRFGLLFSMGPLVGVGAVLASGSLLNQFGPARMIRCCLWGMAVGTLLLGLAGARWLLVLAGLTVCGVFAGPLGIAVNAYLTRLLPRDRRRALALSLAIAGAGGMAMPLLAEGLLALSRRAAWASFALILHGPFLMLALVLLLAGWRYRGDRARPWAGAASVWTWRQFLLPLPIAWLVVLSAVHGAVDSTIITWMPQFLAGASFNVHPLAPGLVLSGFSLSYLVSRSLLVALPESRGRLTLLVLPGLLGGGVLVAGLLSRNAWCAALGYIAAGFLWSAEYPTMLGAMAERGKQHFGTALALSQVVYGALTFVLIYGTGRWVAHCGAARMWQVMTALACGFLLIGMGGAVWVVRFARSRSG